ncbi:retrovirus-related pol polyprotein from transposon TNT 1-94 [Tanacetum coccineum]
MENANLKGKIQEKVFVNTSLKKDLRKLKGKEIVKNAEQIPNATTIVPGMFKLDLDPLAPRYLQGIVEQAKAKQHLDNALDFAYKHAKRIQELLVYVRDTCPTANKPSEKLFVVTPMNKVKKVRASNITCFQLDSSVTQILKLLFGKTFALFRHRRCDQLLGVQKHKLEPQFSHDDMLNTTPICLLSKASNTKSWLWHHQLSHLNFGTINKLAKDGLVRGIPKLKFKKDHLCSACALGKIKKSSHQPKAKDTNQEKLYLLHMDLCGPMLVESINGKQYILVIVDDHSQFTWVKFLRSKDEAPNAIIKCIKNIQVRLNVTVRNVRTDNGTEFVNQTL